MANKQHLEILGEGAERWNSWRQANPDEVPDLSDADLRGINLRQINLERAILTSIEGYGVDLYDSNLRAADLRNAFLLSASLFQADLRRANLSDATLSYSDLGMANLEGARLTGTSLMNSKLSQANLSQADLTGATLRYSQLFDTDLSGATLAETDLMATLLIRVNLEGAILSGCRVHGTAVWKIVTDPHTTQSNLIVTDYADPTVTVDDLEVAQLIHLMIDTAAIRQVIDSMTGKAVLILGRFIGERMQVLSEIGDKLREFGDLPIIFNFDKPVYQSTSETVRTLALLSKFVIADLTDPKSVPYESHLTVPDVAVPFFPIIQEGQSEFSMFEDLYDYDWLLEGFRYRDTAHLLENLGLIRQEALRKREELRVRRRNRKKGFRRELPRNDRTDA